eukprot:1152081-Prymnesium_polylepis.1
MRCPRHFQPAGTQRGGLALARLAARDIVERVCRLLLQLAVLGMRRHRCDRRRHAAARHHISLALGAGSAVGERLAAVELDSHHAAVGLHRRQHERETLRAHLRLAVADRQ